MHTKLPRSSSLSARARLTPTPRSFVPDSGFLESGMAPGPWRSGARACGPDITWLDCVLQRIVGAQRRIVYFFQQRNRS
jgi:hypothetical protein